MSATDEKGTATPGPWRIGRGAQADPYAIEAEARTVAHVKHGRTFDETDANARLIASAPDLLAALKKAVETIRAFDGMGMPETAAADSWDLYQHSPEMRQINAAIAKAEGDPS